MSKPRNYGQRISGSWKWKQNEIYTDKEDMRNYNLCKTDGCHMHKPPDSKYCDECWDEMYDVWLSKEPIKKPIQIDTEPFFDNLMAICKDYKDRHPEVVKPIDAKRQAIEMILHNHYDYVSSEAVNDLYRLSSFTEEKLS